MFLYVYITGHWGMLVGKSYDFLSFLFSTHRSKLDGRKREREIIQSFAQGPMLSNFFVRNLCILVMSQSVNPWQAFPA
jgi:hypothetical protein